MLSQTDIIWLILLGTTVVLTFAAFFIATIIVNQRKFIKIQEEKLEEGNHLQEVLRKIPKQMIEVQEEERKRVARDLHDGINQMLASIKYRAHTIQKQSQSNEEALPYSIEELIKDLEKTMEEVKRISHALRPKVFDDLGFEAAVRSLCVEFTARTNVAVHYHLNDLPEEFQKEFEIGILRIIQEGLNNIEKHAEAHSVTLESFEKNSVLNIVINDDGKGFEQNHWTPTHLGCLGLHTMKERTLLLGGAFDVQSKPMEGTKIIIKIPLK